MKIQKPHSTNQFRQVYDEQGLLSVEYQILPGQERSDEYQQWQAEILEHSPQRIDQRVTRLPVRGDFLIVDRFLWQVEYAIHKPIPLYATEVDLLLNLPATAGIVQISFYRMLSGTL